MDKIFREDEISEEDFPLSVRENSLKVEPKSLEKISSFGSFNFFKDKELIIFNPVKTCNRTLLEGPRRLLRLCLFGLILPVTLISITLYVRLVLFHPYQLSFAPTDQRLIKQHMSSVWCQSQTTHMNGTFNAYMLKEEPRLQRRFQVHHMLRQVVLKDDFKEYWGFFLLKGSVVKVDLCNRYDGGSLMIMRGVDNLRKCAWITQIDSAEADEDEDESNESGQDNRVIQETIPIDRIHFDPIGNYKKAKHAREKEDSSESSTIQKIVPKKSEFLSRNSLKKGPSVESISSAERKELLDLYVERILKLSKASQEIKESFSRLNFTLVRNSKTSSTEEASFDEISAPNINEIKNSRKIAKENKNKEKLKTQDKVKRSLNLEIPDLAKEEEDDISEQNDGMRLLNPGNIQIHTVPKGTHKRQNLTEDELYRQIYKTPKGLNFERGYFNTSTGDLDRSREEQRSSFSSSEEALANCEGLLGAIPLYPDPLCKGYESAPTNRISYKIPRTGTYYFVFSSDNEVFDSNMFFNMTLKRVVYDVSENKETCLNQTDCSLSFSFWSHDQAVIEVPEGPHWNATYILDTKCEPRVPVYLCIIIMIPIFILFCALQ